jgi:ABC-type branched-subunit amino acid transport system substrate-binding protein
MLAAGVGGCAQSTNTSTTVSGTRLTVYASVPSNAPDVLDAEQLALKQAGAQVGKYTVVLRPVTANTPAQVTANARAADQNSTTIAYLGEVAPGSSEASVPITNELGILEVSPTDNALELTQSTSAVSGSRKTYYPSQSSYGYTFGRVAPSAAAEARALVSEISALHVSSLYVTDDGSPYGKAIALAVRQSAKPAVTVATSPASAGAAFVGYSSPTAAAAEFAKLAAANGSLKLFGPSALDTQAFASALPASAQANTFISAPGFMHGDLPAAGASFEQAFASAYGHAPAPQAIFGFAAMNAVLDALHQAGASANNRSTIVDDFHALKNRSSALGTYSIDAAGDITLTPPPFVISRFRAGKLVAFKSVQVPG